MKVIKTFEGFSYDEYVTDVTNQLKQFDLSPRDIMQIITSYEDSIKDYYNSGKFPMQFINDIKTQMGLVSGNYPTPRYPTGKNVTIKYL